MIPLLTTHPHPHLPDMKTKRTNPFIAALAVSLATFTLTHAANKTWDGGGTDNNWNTAANWNAAVNATGDTLIFGGTTRLINTNNVVTSVKGITFNNNAGAFVLGGAAGFTSIILGGDIDNKGTNTTLQTIDLDLILDANRAITLNSSSRLQINGIISESGTGRQLTVNNGAGDDGTLILTGNNSYSGVTTLKNGVLNIQHANALGTTAAGTTISSGAALQIQGGIVTAAEALAIDGTGISTDGALRNISGNNTYSGALTINSATRINSDSGLLTLDVASGNAITGSNDNLTFGGAGDITVADAIATGSGTLTKDGNGKLTLSGANTYTGATSVTVGKLVVDGSLGGTAVSVSGGASLGGTGSIGNATAGGTLERNAAGARGAIDLRMDAIGTLTLADKSAATDRSDDRRHAGKPVFSSSMWVPPQTRSSWDQCPTEHRCWWRPSPPHGARRAYRRDPDAHQLFHCQEWRRRSVQFDAGHNDRQFQWLHARSSSVG